MNCPSCGHENLSDFPFCEHCLELLPPPEGGLGSAFEFDRGVATARVGRSDWPAFPWNPPDLPDPLIGREKAQKQLAAGWDDVVGHWRARIHLLVSEYGMGKSRVATALVADALRRDETTRVIRTRCPAWGGPFRMWDAILRAALDIPDSADPVECGERLSRAVEDVLPDEAAEIAALVAWLTGWDAPGRPRPSGLTDEEALVARSTAALSRLLGAMSVERPLLVIVDQANNATARSLSLAGALEEMLRDRPVMLVLAGSPALTDILPGWEAFPATRLGRLTRRDAERMLRVFLDGLGEPPVEILERILDRAHGSPYAIKSMVRYLRDAGAIALQDGVWALDETVAWDLDLPEDLEGVVLAHLETLNATERDVLGRAAVIGREFWLGALVALERHDATPAAAAAPGDITRDGVPGFVRAALERLAGLKFIERRPAHLPGEEAWVFSSELHWQVAQTMLPEATRQRHHRIILEWLLMHLGDEHGEHCEELARHAEGCGDAARAATWLLEAAQLARAQHHPTDERRLLMNARALVPAEATATRVAVDFDLGDAFALCGDVEAALECYQDALRASWHMRHRGRGAAALARIGRAEGDRGDLTRAYEHLHQALRLYEAIEDRAGVAATSYQLGRLLWLKGRLNEALGSYRKSESISRQVQDRAGIAQAVHAIAALHYDRGDVLLAEEYYNDALSLRRALDDRRGVARTLNDLGLVWTSRGEVERAVAGWREATSMARDIGDRVVEATLASNLGEGLTALGQHDEAEETLERAIALARSIAQPRVLADAWLNLGQLRLSRGQWDAARAALDEAAQATAGLDVPRMTAAVDRAYGELALGEARAPEHQGGATTRPLLAHAQEALRKAADAFSAAGYDLEAATALERLAEALALDDKDDEAAQARDSAKALRGSHEVRPSEATPTAVPAMEEASDEAVDA